MSFFSVTPGTLDDNCWHGSHRLYPLSGTN